MEIPAKLNKENRRKIHRRIIQFRESLIKQITYNRGIRQMEALNGLPTSEQISLKSGHLLDGLRIVQRANRTIAIYHIKQIVWIIMSVTEEN